VKNIRRATRRHFSAEDKIRIVLEGLRGEDSIAELCRCPEPLLPLVERLSRGREEATGWRYGPGRNLGRGQGPAVRGHALKEVVAELTLENSPRLRGPRVRPAAESVRYLDYDAIRICDVRRPAAGPVKGFIAHYKPNAKGTNAI
jgi:transposase